MHTIVARTNARKNSTLTAIAERTTIDAELEDDTINGVIAAALYLAQRAGWCDVVEPLFTARVRAQRRHYSVETGAVR